MGLDVADRLPHEVGVDVAESGAVSRFADFGVGGVLSEGGDDFGQSGSFGNWCVVHALMVVDSGRVGIGVARIQRPERAERR